MTIKAMVLMLSVGHGAKIVSCPKKSRRNGLVHRRQSEPLPWAVIGRGLASAVRRNAAWSPKPIERPANLENEFAFA